MTAWLKLVPGWAYWALALVLVAGGQQVRVLSAQSVASKAQAEYQAHLRQVAEANAAVIRKQQSERRDLEIRLAANDQQRYGELRHAQQEIERLSAAVADGSRRLSVRASCPAAAGGLSAATGTGSLDDGTGTRITLLPETAARFIRVAGEADQCQIKLRALQSWANTVTGK